MQNGVESVAHDPIVVVGHTDIVASDVDWRREAGETHVLDQRHAPTLRKGGAHVVCDHIGGDARYGYLPATRLDTNQLQRCMRAFDHTWRDVEESENFVIAKTVADIHRARAEGKIAFVICLEGAAPLENEISYLRNFYRLGLRCLGLTHDMRNAVADGIRERSGGGLTYFGVQVVQECDRLGIVVDVSHLSDRGTSDVLEVSKMPVIASHSNARSLCPTPRNLPDDLIRGIAESGGVIGFHALNRLVSPDPEPTLGDIVRQIEYVAKVGGVDCIGIGPDLMENWDPMIVQAVSERSTTINGVPVNRLDYRYPEEMGSLAHIPNVSAALLQAGFSREDVSKFLGGNFMRVFEIVWKAD